MDMQRRTFLKTTGAGIACACLACTDVAKSVEGFMASPNPPDSFRVEGNKLIIDLSKHPKLKETGGWASFEADKKKVIVLHPAEQDYKALANKCTHKGSTLNYKPKDGFIQCPLHGSRFDIEGKVLKGPAAQPLTGYKTTLDKDQLTVDLA